MNALQLFEYENHEVRVVQGGDGEPFFVAKDVAEVLGYSNPLDAVTKHCKSAIQDGFAFRDSIGRTQKTTIIPERDMYRLVMRSKLPAAERFEEWVVGEVLPKIRKHGVYAIPAAPVLPQTYLQALEALVDSEKQKLALEAKIEEDAPKVAFADAVAASPSTILIGELAKLLRQNGVVIGPHRLFEWMRQNKYLMKQSKTENIPTQHAMELGLFEIHERVVELPTGVSVIKKTTRVTGTGQQFFIQQFLGTLQRVS